MEIVFHGPTRIVSHTRALEFQRILSRTQLFPLKANYMQRLYLSQQSRRKENDRGTVTSCIPLHLESREFSIPRLAII